MTLRYKIDQFIQKIKRYILTTEVTVYPDSLPEFPCHTEVHMILFRALRVKVDNFMTPRTNKENVDIGYIIQEVPWLDKLVINEPVRAKVIAVK